MHNIMTFYGFSHWPDYRDAQGPLQELCGANRITGSILLASEGINGTVAGKHADLEVLLKYLDTLPPLIEPNVKFSRSVEQPFRRLRVRLKKEIVSLGIADLDLSQTGTFVEAEDWNELLSEQDLILIDARNDYEVAIGSFPGALNPKTQSFRELPEWLAHEPALASKPKVAMFCTGGIRCEKVSAHLKHCGFSEVYQLRGGILKYLEQVPQPETQWKGECYVFDGRVSVGPGLVPGDLELCPNCNAALSPVDRAHSDYEKGVTCSGCADTITPERRQRFSERQRQMDLAEERGVAHLGSGSQQR